MVTFRNISSSTITESTISNPVDNALIPEPDYERPHSTSSMPETGSDPLLESNELLQTHEQSDLAVPPDNNEMDNLSYEDDITSESAQLEVENQDDIESDLEFEIDSGATKSKTKSMLSTSTPSTKSKSTGTSIPPLLPSRSKYPLLKKVPTRLIAAANNKTKPQKKVVFKVTRSTTKRSTRLTTTKIRRPGTPFPHSRDPNHPHGVVVFDKRKKRPKPGHRRHTTKATTTTTTPTTTSTTTTRKPLPLEPDYYDYDWGVGESGESKEKLGSNSSNSNKNATTTSNHKPPIPLSKLAMAMIASSDIFENGTGSDDDMFYPKTPVNLLHILQSYTKQLQQANAQSTVKQPAVQIQTTPFMLQLSQLNFGTRIAISIYYSLIAIIPLVYLAFGGLGRLGFLNALAGRGFGRRRRKRRSYGGNQYYFGGNDGYQTTIIQRSNLNERNDDEYTWILGRISEIILEFSLMSDEIEK